MRTHIIFLFALTLLVTSQVTDTDYYISSQMASKTENMLSSTNNVQPTTTPYVPSSDVASTTEEAEHFSIFGLDENLSYGLIVAAIVLVVVIVVIIVIFAVSSGGKSSSSGGYYGSSLTQPPVQNSFSSSVSEMTSDLSNGGFEEESVYSSYSSSFASS